jgi:hypothetical protein
MAREYDYSLKINKKSATSAAARRWGEQAPGNLKIRDLCLQVHAQKINKRAYFRLREPARRVNRECLGSRRVGRESLPQPVPHQRKERKLGDRRFQGRQHRHLTAIVIIHSQPARRCAPGVFRRWCGQFQTAGWTIGIMQLWVFVKIIDLSGRPY